MAMSRNLTRLSFLSQPLKLPLWILSKGGSWKLLLEPWKMVSPSHRRKYYHALNDLEAGQPLDRSIGSNTSVYTGCFTNDWQNLTLKDSEECTNQAGVGVESSFLANRLSWFFNFRGTSFNVDSACSSSLVCVDLACKSLVSGESDMVSVICALSIVRCLSWIEHCCRL